MSQKSISSFFKPIKAQKRKSEVSENEPDNKISKVTEREPEPISPMSDKEKEIRAKIEALFGFFNATYFCWQSLFCNLFPASPLYSCHTKSTNL